MVLVKFMGQLVNKSTIALLCFVMGLLVGVINPPPDLRLIVDKTAMFVAKNGKKFEAK